MMGRVRCWTLMALLIALGGCEEPTMRVPPAAEWKPPEVQPSVVGSGAASSAGARDPHAAAGSRPSRAPHDGDGPHRTPGEDEDAVDPDDPHAGLDMGGADDPHAGLDMEGAPDDLGGLEPPDPDRPIDQTKFLRGTIRAGGKAGVIAPGATVFVSAWPVDTTTGDVLGAPLAVEKLTADKLPLAFRLDERNMMVKGTRFEGEVIVVARVDKDGEARTKEPGDVEGRARARIPSEKVAIVLDTVLR
jgi:hypothetical protein